MNDEPDHDVQRVEVVGQIPAATQLKLFALGTSFVLFVMLSVFAFFVYSEANARNDLIYQQCVDGELRDTVIVDQLEAARDRLASAIPNPMDPVRIQQEEILNDGILTLEPLDESECFRPHEWWPW